jgi:DNA replication protein DnaC
MLRDQLALRKPAQYVYVPDWLDALRDAEREGNPRMVFDAVASFRGLLALDELIADRHTTYGLDRLLQLVDRRSREKLMTVATANLKPMPTRDGADCIHDMSPRLASRLAEWWVYSWSGRDRRMRPNRSGQSGQSA